MEGHYVEAADSGKPPALPFSQVPNPLAKASLPSVIFAQWIQPMVSLGSRRVLEIDDMWPECPSDKSESLEKRFHRVYEPKRQYLFGLSPVFMAYVKVFRVDLAIVLVCCAVYVLALGLQTYVTRALLEFLNGEENVFHISSGYWLLVMMVGSSLVAVCVLNYLFFIDSRIGSNMRTLTMSLVYNKALRLSSSARQEYTTGEILTLMSVDTERVFTAMVQGPWLVMGPLAFVVSCVLIGFLLDFYAALAGAIVLTVIMVISMQQGDRIADLQKRLLKVIDERVKVTSETLQGIRVMKFYAWEESLAQRVEKLRVKEVTLLRKFHSYQVINTVMLFITPTFLSGATLGLYVLIRHTITIVEAFTLVAMVNIARAPLNQLPQAVAGLSKAKIAYKRVDAFLATGEVPATSIPPETSTEATPSSNTPFNSAQNGAEAAVRGHISIQDGVFDWPTNPTQFMVVTPTEDEFQEKHEKQVLTPDASSDSIKSGFQLEGINLEIERGSLVMIVGRVGAGKSSLVNAILGEMPRTSGVLDIGGRIAYVSQDTWIRNATLRDNILFEQEYDAERYAQVLDASQLTMDLKALPNGDSTEIGERGINLSGGQKARVAIARAMYRTETDVLILDDPLSAVDPHVAHAIFDKCVAGLAREQTRLLVLNSHYDLLPSADHVIVMQDGIIASQGSYEQVLMQFPLLTMHFVSVDGNDEVLVKDAEVAVAKDQSEDTIEDDTSKPSGRLIKAEDRVKGKVSGQVYKTYFDETGFNGIVVIIVIVLVYIAGQAARTIVDWWPGHWARNMPRRGVDPTYSNTNFGMWYLGFIVLCSLLSFGRALMMIESCIRSSQHMHDDLFRRVLRAPVTKYFDVTPMGQILNRFSNDLDQMDTMLPQEYQLLLQNVSLALGALAVSAFASYWIALTYIPIFGVFLFIGQYFKKTSSEIKRLEGVTRTPVYNLFSETLSGLATIRAFRMEQNFIEQNRRVVDANSNLYFTYWAASRWLATRLDLLSVVIIFVVTLYLVATAGSIGSLTSGLSLTYSLMLTSMVQWVMRSVDRTDNAMTSVERLLFFRQIESEADTGATVAELLQEELTDNKTHQVWPLRGSIRFDQLCLRYRPELPLVLKGVNLEVAAGEKVGICGRTGAGKSSLMIALFRICDFDSGRVLIDDVDIATINLRELRRSLAIIPQDPVLFSGPLRENLDPFHEYSDERIWHVLEQVHMADSLRRWGAGLDFEVAEGGDNLSVGQRQLICIGRALLKDSKVVVLDEATANVDTATDALIQTTIQETFKDKTVLIIAHRINTIMHCDKIAVMDAGRVAEFDSPSTLLARPTSVFAALAKRSGAA
ncbi:ABC transporter C family member 3 [Phytophthora citrophthora]|uniref:ABC transporter C family member 3 n=1 Tax=Phytophthora citrophthora TaxID=4793 RepID=A0AAD9GGL6_9STRA|nr:ABC transporter C family member 3 [Phytophthora citrophthora]